MHLTESVLGAHFGNLAKVHGILTYKLSPFEQKAFAGAISHGVPNTIRRIQSNILRVGPPFIVGIVIYNVTEWRHAKLQRKDPSEFADDI